MAMNLFLFAHIPPSKTDKILPNLTMGNTTDVLKQTETTYLHEHLDSPLSFILGSLLLIILVLGLFVFFFLSKKSYKCKWTWETIQYQFSFLSFSSCYASWHIGQGQVSSTLLCCWLFFLLCPRCILFPLFHFQWCASMLFLVFLFFFSLLVSMLGLALSYLLNSSRKIRVPADICKHEWCQWKPM